MRHPISGELKEMNEEEFLAQFCPTVHDLLKRNHASSGVEALVILENLQMDSPYCGERTALSVGPGCTYKLEDVCDAGFRLGSVPSMFQYPTAVWRKERVNDDT